MVISEPGERPRSRALARRNEASTSEFDPSRHFAATQQFGRFGAKRTSGVPPLPNRIYEYAP
jgi:hypothetical protein